MNKQHWIKSCFHKKYFIYLSDDKEINIIKQIPHNQILFYIYISPTPMGSNQIYGHVL